MDNAARSSSHGPSQKSEIRSMVGLALPVVTVQVGMMTMGVVDTLMVGRVSPVALAAVALGNLYFIGLAIFGIGVVAVLDPIIAQAVGARDRIAISRGLQRGLVIAAALSVPTSLLLAPGEYFLTFLRQPAERSPCCCRLCARLHSRSFPLSGVCRSTSSPAGCGRREANRADYRCFKSRECWTELGLDLRSSRVPATRCGRLCVGNELLPLSHDRRALGLRLERVATASGSFTARYVHRRFLETHASPGPAYWVPVAAGVGSFAVAALLIGWLGTYAMGAHQIAINLASLTYMVPLGVSAAAAVRVGYAVGRGDPPGARRSAAAALACGGAFMLLAGILFFAVPGGLARLYTEESAVIAIASTLIPIAGFFQVFDGLQIVAAGVLRGLGDTRAPLVINLFGFWLIGLPVSVFLAFVAGAGPAGIWWGFVAGLGSVAVFLLGRVRFRLRREMRRSRRRQRQGTQGSNAENDLTPAGREVDAVTESGLRTPTLGIRTGTDSSTHCFGYF